MYPGVYPAVESLPAAGIFARLEFIVSFPAFVAILVLIVNVRRKSISAIQFKR